MAMTRGAQFIVAAKAPNQEVRLLRFRADGTIEQTFGSRGVTLTSSKAARGWEGGPALTHDRILVAGAVYNPLKESSCLARERYAASGQVDRTFGADGLRDEMRSRHAPVCHGRCGRRIGRRRR